MNTVPYTFTPPPEESVRTRCGYTPAEVIQSLTKTLAATGALSTGQVLHFTADLVCSGGFNSFARTVWEYALTHVGIASPRIFVYLKQRTNDIIEMLKTLPDETAYLTEEFQIRVGEIVLVTRDAPTRSLVPWPKVGQETHDEGWIRAIKTDPVTESAALRIVWRPEGDMAILRTAGSHLCKAIADGSVDKALFWIKWLLEEEIIVHKLQKGASLSSIERGPAGLSAKARKDVTFFILQLYSEIYKELSAKNLVRMNEEFQTLIELIRNPPKGLNAKRHIFVILTQILVEVPKWKTPAAQPLIKDPIYLARAVKMVPKFFQEVLKYDSPKKQAELAKALKNKGGVIPKPKTKEKEKGALTQMEAFDKAMEAYMGGK
jgi:hypothetical protein